MGKLRKLRRQIEREPEKWMWKGEWQTQFEPDSPYHAYGALGGWRGSKKFIPCGWLRGFVRPFPHPYQRFVRRVLKDLGYNVY